MADDQPIIFIPEEEKRLPSGDIRSFQVKAADTFNYLTSGVNVPGTEEVSDNEMRFVRPDAPQWDSTGPDPGPVAYNELTWRERLALEKRRSEVHGERIPRDTMYVYSMWQRGQVKERLEKEGLSPRAIARELKAIREQQFRLGIAQRHDPLFRVRPKPSKKAPKEAAPKQTDLAMP